MSNKTKISIVILNWNRAEDTIQCLKSISQLQVAGYELGVIVVDNGSIDNSIGRIKKYLRKFVSATNKISRTKRSRAAQICDNSHKITAELIENRTNLGFAGGNNVGIKHALNHGSDFILLLNNDTVVDKNLIVGLLETTNKYPKAGMISPKIYFAKGFEFHKKRYKKSELGKVIWYAGGKMDWNNILGSNKGVDEVDVGQFKKTEKIDFATGACVLLRRKAVEEVGMFDGKYYLYLEDADLSERMKKAGWKVLYSPKGFLWHKVSQSSGIGSELNDYFITRNRLLFGMSYANWRTKIALYKESLRLLQRGRVWQRKGVIDFYFMRYGKGSWRNK